MNASIEVLFLGLMSSPAELTPKFRGELNALIERTHKLGYLTSDDPVEAYRGALHLLDAGGDIRPLGAGRLIEFTVALADATLTIVEAFLDASILDPEISAPFDIRQGVAAVAHSVIKLGGMLDALEAEREIRVERAADGRRRLGQDKRELVRSAAEKHRGRTSKEKAASAIAEEINASPASVRTLLSKLYPGKDWSEQKV